MSNLLLATGADEINDRTIVNTLHSAVELRQMYLCFIVSPLLIAAEVPPYTLLNADKFYRLVAAKSILGIFLLMSQITDTFFWE